MPGLNREVSLRDTLRLPRQKIAVIQGAGLGCQAGPTSGADLKGGGNVLLRLTFIKSK